MMKRRIAFIAVLMVAVMLLTGCAKENKYVNVGVTMTTDGISVCLTGLAKELAGVSEYVFFSSDVSETIKKLTEPKQNIDVSYMRVQDLSRLKKEMKLSVIAVDCLDPDGSLKGVWVARNGWLTDAPKYSKLFAAGLVKCLDYRASHKNMTYAKALETVKSAGSDDLKFDVFDDVMQFCAIYSHSNNEEIADTEFNVFGRDKLASMMNGFESGEGELYRLCRESYDRYCQGSDMTFEEMFNMKLLEAAMEETAE